MNNLITLTVQMIMRKILLLKLGEEIKLLDDYITKEQTKILAKIGLKAKIRFRFGRNQTPFSQFRFRSCRNRNLIMKFGFNRIIRPKLSKENQETKELLKMRGKHK